MLMVPVRQKRAEKCRHWAVGQWNKWAVVLTQAEVGEGLLQIMAHRFAQLIVAGGQNCHGYCCHRVTSCQSWVTRILSWVTGAGKSNFNYAEKQQQQSRKQTCPYLLSTFSESNKYINKLVAEGRATYVEQYLFDIILGYKTNTN